MPVTDKQPLHTAISQKLKQQIEAGQYPPGDRLPSEFDLGELFGVSRTTIRRAVANLIHQGMVTTQQGKGTFVSDRQKISFSMSNPLMRFDLALQQQGYTAHIKSLRFERVQPPPEVARKLQLPDPTSKVYQQEKIIYADDSPIALELDYFPDTILPELADQLREGFTYSVLAANGVQLNAAKVSLESIPTTHELSQYLEAPLGMPLLVFSYVTYQCNRQPVVCGKTLSRSDWTCYTSEFEIDNVE